LVLALSFSGAAVTLRRLKQGLLPSLAAALGCCGALAGSCAAMSLYGRGLLSAGRILAAFGTAACSYCLPQPIAGAFTASICAGSMLAETGFAFGAAAYAAAACCALLLKPHGKAAFAIGFLLPAAALGLCAPSELYGAVYLTELFCGSLLFLALPLPQFRAATLRIDADNYAQATAAVQQKLQSAAQSMQDISTLLERTLPNVTEPNKGEMLAACVERVCRSCSSMSDCWLKNYDNTHAAFLSLADTLTQNGTLTREELQRTFHGSCIWANKLCSELCESYRRSISAAREQRSAVICREMLKEQFAAVAEMLCGIQNEVARMGSWDERRSKRICEQTARLGMEALTVYCAADPAAPRIHICLRQEPTPQQLSRLASALSPTVGSTLQPSAAQKTPRGWTVTLRAAPRYSLQTAAAQHSASRAACGDVYTVFQNEEDARSHLLLCDGMGSGSSAAQDGALSCSLLCRLLANGFDVYAAARLINAVFSLRQDTEAACTLDLFSFDSISGEGQLLKAGAAASYLLQQGAVQRFAGRTLPVGILDKVFCAKQTLQLQPGDILLLVSDGLDDHADTVARLLKQHSTSPLDVLCRDVLKAAKERGLRDDATVLAARVCERA
ncbi:MAG: SpoIIE family protein phosphatase, partial [Oscillospiraceae bacterium]|nr:SpoIIE family protein phosphatase [Oscillospiraceae bacterium]